MVPLARAYPPRPCIRREERNRRWARAMTNLTTVVYSSCVCSVTRSFIVSVPQPREERKVEDWAQAVPDLPTPATPSCTRLDKP